MKIVNYLCHSTYLASPQTQILSLLKRLFAFYLVINNSKQSAAFCDTRARVLGYSYPNPPTTTRVKNEIDLTYFAFLYFNAQILKLGEFVVNLFLPWTSLNLFFASFSIKCLKRLLRNVSLFFSLRWPRELEKTKLKNLLWFLYILSKDLFSFICIYGNKN